MDIPLCLPCAKSGIICRDCEKKLASGKITELDASLAKLLIDSGLSEVGFERAIEGAESIIILAKKESIGKLIGRGGENLKMLSSALKKKVKVIGAENLEDAIHDFIAPAHVASINKVFLPDGSLSRKIMIGGEEKKKLRMEVREIEKLISSLTSDKIEISFS